MLRWNAYSHITNVIAVNIFLAVGAKKYTFRMKMLLGETVEYLKPEVQ